MLKAMRVLLFYSLVLFCHSSNDFGPFDVAVQSVKSCKGPKLKDCATSTVYKQNSEAHYDVNVLENVIPTKAKIVASAKNRPTIRLQINNPCKHLFVKPILKSVLNATDNCTISKGRYNILLNLSDTFKKYYGGSFLYGNWTFHSTLYSDSCNFICTETVIELYPQKGQKK